MAHVVFVLVVTVRVENLLQQAVSWHPQKVSCPAEFFLMRRYSIEGSPARLRTFMLVTLSCHLIFMIDLRMSHHESV